jgi:hypothetical protein
MAGSADAQNLAKRVQERLSSDIQMELSNPAFHPFFLRDVVLKLLVAAEVRDALLTQRREIDGQLVGGGEKTRNSDRVSKGVSARQEVRFSDWRKT